MLRSKKKDQKVGRLNNGSVRIDANGSSLVKDKNPIDNEQYPQPGIYLDSVGDDLIEPNNDFSERAIRANSIRKRSKRRKSFKYKLDIPLEELELHPNSATPKVRLLRDTVQKHIQLRHINESNEKRLIRRQIQALIGSDQSTNTKSISLVFYGIPYKHLMWYFWDPLIAAVFIYEMLIFSFT